MKPALVALFAGCAHVANPFGVDPFIGTAGGDLAAPISRGPGNTFPGAVLPWGMVSVSPHNDAKAPSGYTHGRPLMSGFGHVHLSGVGCPELGNVLLAATTGSLDYASSYSHEQAHPGYYAVRLDRFGITAEATATTRVGLTRFTFPDGDARILVDLGRALVPSVATHVRIASPSEIEGSDTGGGFCGMKNRHTVHFVARFSKPAVATGSEGAVAWARFATRAREPIVVAVGISYTSIAHARMNLDREAVNFDSAVRAAESRWSEALGRVRIEGGTAEQRTIFYTALYHMLLHPNVFDDVDGSYIGMRNGGIRRGAPDTRYTVYSLWDTYRGVHPFLTLVYPERQRDMVRSMIEMYRESGWLPKWELAGDETHVMVGDPAAIVIADTWLRGLRDFDADTALRAMLAQATLPRKNDLRPGNAVYLEHGYIPDDDGGGDWIFGSVSTTLEYALSDWAISRMAVGLGHEREAAALLARSRAWQKTFDGALGLQRPRKRDGSWLTPFDPAATCCDKPWPESGGPGFVEGSAWQYTFFVPHDVEALAGLLGGAHAFVTKLQSLFDTRRFSLGNEPVMGHPYLFTFVPGEEWRTQQLVRALLDSEFHASPDGLPGNDDAGALSAWYVWSALGLYPTCPASNRYEIGSPLFDRATIRLPHGRTFTVVARRASRSTTGFHLSHETVARGGTLVVDMLPAPP